VETDNTTVTAALFQIERDQRHFRKPLENYLDKLVIRKTRGNDPIRAYGLGRCLRHKRGSKSLKEVSRISGIKYKNICNWLGDSERDIGIPIKDLKAISKVLKINSRTLFALTNYFGCTNSRKSRLPRHVTPKLAYLLGYIMGDGHLAKPYNFQWVGI
jgi:hypothetical protein